MTFTIACLDMAGTTVGDDGVVLDAFEAAISHRGLSADGYARAMKDVRATMGQSKIEVFRRILGDEDTARQANQAFEQHYEQAVRAGQVAPLPGAAQTLAALRVAGLKVCLLTGFSPSTRDALLDALDWRPLIDLALSPADAGRGRPWPDLPLTALLRLGGADVRELAVAGDTRSDVESGLRAGAGRVGGVVPGGAPRAARAAAGAPPGRGAPAGPILFCGSRAMPWAAYERWSIRTSWSSSASRAFASSAQRSRHPTSSARSFQTRSFLPNPSPSTARIDSMTCACGCASPSPAVVQCTLRSATMPRDTNCSRTKSCASRTASACPSSRGKLISMSRASWALCCRSAVSASFHKVPRSSQRAGAPSGSRISECTTPVLAV